MLLDNDAAIGFLHIGSDLGQVSVGRNADGAANLGANLPGDALFDALCQRQRIFFLALAAGQPADHFIDRQRSFDVRAGFNHRNQFVMVFNV